MAFSRVARQGIVVAALAAAIPIVQARRALDGGGPTPAQSRGEPRAGEGTAETIYYNGQIVTMWGDHPVVEALAIRGSRFLAVGSTADVRKLAGPATREIDLRGRTVLPGLQDSHTHPISAALSEQDAAWSQQFVPGQR